jgi:phage gp45-like
MEDQFTPGSLSGPEPKVTTTPTSAPMGGAGADAVAGTLGPRRSHVMLLSRDPSSRKSADDAAALVVYLASGAADVLTGRPIRASDDIVQMVVPPAQLQERDLCVLRERE